MIAHGKVTGPYARKYAEYCYRKLIDATIGTYARPDKSYPNRYIETVDLLDYTVEVTGDDGLKAGEYANCVVEFYLEPNEYTQAKKRRRVLRVIVDHYYSEDMNNMDSLTQLVFEPVKTEVKINWKVK